MQDGIQASWDSGLDWPVVLVNSVHDSKMKLPFHLSECRVSELKEASARLPAEPVKQKMVVDMYQSLKELHH